MTARGAAGVYSVLLGYSGDVALVSPRRFMVMAAVTFTGMDQVMGFPTRWAFGYSPGRPGGVPSRPGSAFGMAGMNGSAAYADIDSGVAVAVMCNRCTPVTWQRRRGSTGSSPACRHDPCDPSRSRDPPRRRHPGGSSEH